MLTAPIGDSIIEHSGHTPQRGSLSIAFPLLLLLLPPPDYPFFVGSSVYKRGDHQFPHDRLRAKGKRNRPGREARMLTPYLPAIAE